MQRMDKWLDDRSGGRWTRMKIWVRGLFGFSAPTETRSLSSQLSLESELEISSITNPATWRERSPFSFIATSPEESHFSKLTTWQEDPPFSRLRRATQRDNAPVSRLATQRNFPPPKPAPRRRKSLATQVAPTPMPRRIHETLTNYKRAGDAFTKQCLEAAERYRIGTSRYTKVERSEWVDYDGEEWQSEHRIIFPAQGYVELAKKLVKKRPSASLIRALLRHLHDEIEGRETVDEWYANLPHGDPQKRKVTRHRSFTEVLRETERVLCRGAA